MATTAATLVGITVSRKTSDFGKRLAEFRKQANLSVYALAKMSGVTQSAIARIERCERDPAWTTAIALAKALGVSLSEFDALPPPDDLPQP